MNNAPMDRNVLALLNLFLKSEFNGLIMDGIVSVETKVVNGGTAPTIFSGFDYMTFAYNGVQITVKHEDIATLNFETYGSEQQYTAMHLQTTYGLSIVYTVKASN